MTKYSLLVVPFTSLTFGISLTSFEILKDTLLKTMNTEQWSHAISIFCIGALITNMTIGYLKTTIKTKIILAQFCFFFGTLLLFIHNFYIVMIARFINGIGTGIVCCIVPLYLNLLAPIDYRGTVGCFHQFGIVVGVLLGQVMSWIFDKKEPNLALVILATFYTVLIAALFFIENTLVGSVKRKSIFELLKNKSARKSIIVSVIFHIGQQASCINGVIFFCNTILEKVGDPKLKTVYVSIVSLLSSIVALFVVDKAGRKLLFIASCLICCFSLTLLGYEIQTFYMLFLFMIGFNIGLGPIVWMVVGELFEEDYKSAGIEIAVAANWISNYGVLMSFGLMTARIGAKSFLVFAGSMVAVMGLIAILYTETKGKPSAFLK